MTRNGVYKQQGEQKDKDNVTILSLGLTNRNKEVGFGEKRVNLTLEYCVGDGGTAKQKQTEQRPLKILCQGLKVSTARFMRVETLSVLF